MNITRYINTFPNTNTKTITRLFLLCASSYFYSLHSLTLARSLSFTLDEKRLWRDSCWMPFPNNPTEPFVIQLSFHCHYHVCLLLCQPISFFVSVLFIFIFSSHTRTHSHTLSLLQTINTNSAHCLMLKMVFVPPRLFRRHFCYHSESSMTLISLIMNTVHTNK